MVGHFTGRTTLGDIRKARPRTIYYGARTCWWTHRSSDLRRHPGCGLPCDPRCGVLMETNDVAGFLKAAEDNPAHYGRHGLEVFMAAHNDNMVVSKADPRPTCFETWDEYNDVLDRQVPDAR